MKLRSGKPDKPKDGEEGAKLIAAGRAVHALASPATGKRSLLGRVFTAVDGRRGFCTSVRPRGGSVTVIVIGAPGVVELWGPAQIEIS